MIGLKPNVWGKKQIKEEGSAWIDESENKLEVISLVSSPVHNRWSILLMERIGENMESKQCLKGNLKKTFLGCLISEYLTEEIFHYILNHAQIWVRTDTSDF